MRRRLNLNKLSDQILIVVHQRFFDDTIEYMSFQQIRESLKDQPTNAIRLELSILIEKMQIVQQTVERTRNSGFLSTMNQTPATYLAPVDGYKISKAGIIHVDEFGDDYYNSIEKELTSSAASPESLRDEEIDWEPIPLERDDDKQTVAMSALDKVVDELRGDNGYAATNPEEKAYVQDKLLAVTKRLKEASQISWMYLSEFAFKPLAIIIKRFGGAALGVAAAAANEALASWLKSKGMSFLDGMLD
jgi:hypothetical protein